MTRAPRNLDDDAEFQCRLDTIGLGLLFRLRRRNQIHSGKHDSIRRGHRLSPFEVPCIRDVRQDNVIRAAAQGTLQVCVGCDRMHRMTGFTKGRFETGVGQRLS